MMTFVRRIALSLGVAGAALLLACGGASDEEKLLEATAGLADARATVANAQDAVEERKATADEAAVALAEAQEALRSAEAQLREAESQVDQNATDAVLFRGVQQRLLEEENLENVAIRAQVKNGLVTLRGSVPREELRKLAIEVARSTPGVSVVESEIVVTAVLPPE